MAHFGGVAAVRLQVPRERHHRPVVSALGGKQQTLGIQVVDDGDVVLPAPQARLVDTHEFNACEVLQRACLLNVDRYAATAACPRSAATQRPGAPADRGTT